jgi:hypothetical protein
LITMASANGSKISLGHQGPPIPRNAKDTFHALIYVPNDIYHRLNPPVKVIPNLRLSNWRPE